MTGMASYTRKSLVIMASEIALQLKACVVLPLVTKLFGAVSYGIWNQVEVLQCLLAPLVIMGLDSATLRFAPGRPREEMSRGMTGVLAYSLGSGLFIGLLLWGLAGPVATAFFGGSQNAAYVALCVPALLATALLSLSRTFLLTLGAAHMVALLRVAEGALLLAPLLWVLLTRGDFFELVVGNIGVLAVLGLVGLGLLWRNIPPRRPDPALLGRYLRYGAAAMPAGYAVWVLNLSDRFFISSYRGLAELGVYSSVYSLAYIVISLFFNPFWVMYPAQAAQCHNEGRLDDLRRLYRHSTRMATLLVVPASVGLAVLGPAVLTLLTTPEFLPGARLLPLISLAYALSMYGAYFSIHLGLIRKPHLTTLAMFAAAGCNIALNFLLIPTWGILGAAVSTLAAFGLQFVIEWHLSRRLFLPRLGFDGLGAVKAVAGSLVMALALWAGGLDVPGSPVKLAGGVCLGAAVYAASQLVLRNLTGEELRQLCALAGLGRLTGHFPLRELATYLDGPKGSGEKPPGDAP